MLRIAGATFLSGLWAPLYTAFFAAFLFPQLADLGADWSLLYAASIYWTFGFVYGFIPMMVLAPLAHMVLRWRRHKSLAAYLIAWFLVSQVLWWGGLRLAPVEDDLVDSLIFALLFNLPWIPAGATFWAIARPDLRTGKTGEASEHDERPAGKTVMPTRPRSQFGMRGRMPS